MAPKKFTYTPGTGGGKRTAELSATAKRRKAAFSRVGGRSGEDKFGNFARDVKDVLSYKGTIDPAKRNQSTSMEDRRKAMAMGQAAVAKNAGRSTIEKGDVVKYGINWGKKPKKRLRNTVKEIIGVDINNPNVKDIGIAAASFVPVGRVAKIAKGVANAAQAGKAAESGAKAYSQVNRPIKPMSMVNKQRRADLAKIEAKTGTASPKTGAGSANAAPKQRPKKSPPTVPPTKGAAIKTDDTPKIGSRPRAPLAIPEGYRATRPTNVAGETIKPFDAPKPYYQQFKVDGKYGEAEKAKFEAAAKEWKRKSKAAEKKATTAPAEQRTGTPIEKMREDVNRARFRQAKGNIYKAGKEEGSTEAKIQNAALKEEAAVDRARGAKYSEMLKETPGGVMPERPSVRYPNEGTRGGKTYDSRKSKFTTRPAKIRVAPKRENFASDAKYKSAKNKYDKAIADARAKADVKQAQVKPAGEIPTTRPEVIAKDIAPKAPSRKGGFKETGSRFRFEGKTGNAGEPKMTKRPKLTEEAYVDEASIKANKQFQGIRPGKEVPEYRNVIDNLPDAKPAPKAASAPKKQSAKSKAGTKPAEIKPAETPAAPAAAAPKTPKKSSASKPAKPAETKPTETPVETPAAPAAAKTPKKTAAKKTTPAPAEKTTPAAKATPPKKAKVAKEEPLPERPADSKFKSRETPASNRGVFKNKAGARYVTDVKAQKALDNLVQPKAAAKPAKPKTTKSRLIKGAAVTGGVGAAGVALKLTRDSDVSPNQVKSGYQAGAGLGRLSKLTIRKAQADRAAAATKAPPKKFGAAGESKFLKGRSAVRQSVIDQINKQGMAKSLAAVKSRRNDPEYLEAIRRYYGAKRLKQALEG